MSVPPSVGIRRIALLTTLAVVVTIVAFLAATPSDWSGLIEVRTDASLSVDTKGYELGDPWLDSTVSFDIATSIDHDRRATITEDIIAWFTPGSHGIERLIPVSDATGDHPITSLTVATDADAPDDVEVSDTTVLVDGREIPIVRIRIGDPDTTISGFHRYRLTYVMDGTISDVDSTTGPIERFRFDAFSDWRQVVGSSRATVTGPTGIVRAGCVESTGRGERPCADVSTMATATSASASFVATGPIPPGGGYTMTIDWPAGTFGPAVITPRPRPSVGSMVIGLTFVVLGAIAAVLIATRRDHLLRRRAARGLSATFGGVIPADLDGDSILAQTPPVEFVPPLDLRPAELVRLRDGARATSGVVLSSTIIDLAASGVITLDDVTETDWTITRRTPDRSGVPLNSYETELLELLDGDDGPVRLSDRLPEMAAGFDRVRESLDAGLVERGLLTRSIGGLRRSTSHRPTSRGIIGSIGWVFGGAMFLIVLATVMVIAVVLGAIIGVGARAAVGPDTAAPIAGLLGAAMLAAITAITARRFRRAHTDTGLAAGFRIGGFERFFDDSESIHARAASESGLLRDYMGYAVAFGVLDRWLREFPDSDLTGVGIDPNRSLSAQWFTNAALLTRITMPNTANTGIGSSAGYSGGGGGFGGGSGGGGGGSW